MSQGHVRSHRDHTYIISETREKLLAGGIEYTIEVKQDLLNVIFECLIIDALTLQGFDNTCEEEINFKTPYFTVN